MKGLWRIGLVVVLVLLSGYGERERMIREARRNTPPTVVAGGR